MKNKPKNDCIRVLRFNLLFEHLNHVQFIDCVSYVLWKRINIDFVLLIVGPSCLV